MRALTIDPKFKDLIPALSDEEYGQLEANCIADGILDPIKVWSHGSIIVDGHNRYQIAQEHGLKFAVHSLAFPDREAVENWIDQNQLGRRNLTPDMMSLLRGRIYNRSKKGHGGDRTGAKGQSDLLNGTAEILAPKLGVAPKTLKRDGAFAEAVERLDLAGDVAAGKVEAPRAQVIETAKALPENPTDRQVQRARQSVEAPRPRPEPRPKVLPDRGGTGELEQLRRLVNEREAQLEEVRTELQETLKLLRDTEEENKSFGRVIEADDQVAAAMAEAKRFRELARVTQERNNGLMGQNHALARDAKRWMNKFLRLERLTKGELAASEPEPNDEDLGDLFPDLDPTA